jgi:filamentous hemagglutinin family protein
MNFIFQEGHMSGFKPFWRVRKKAVYFVTASFIALTMTAHAAPTGGQVTAGIATINQSANTTTVNQSSQNAAINWQSFSIGANEAVNFVQPNTSAITLNRVIGNETSLINGALNANGQVFILNSNGVLFGRNASVNTSGLIATTMSLSDSDFMAGNYNFTDATDAAVINMGTINIADSGYAALLAKNVENSGTISAVRGKIYMTAADSVRINLNGNSLVSLTVDKGIVDALVDNGGAVIAKGGEIYLTAHAADELVKSVVNNTGIAEAESIDDVAGSIMVYAYDGHTNVSGTLNATGGFIETSGDSLTVTDTAVIKASEWLIDPVDITIESTGGSDMGGSSISATALESALSGANVTLTADNDINVNEDVSYSANTLTLTAGNDINVNSEITLIGTAGISLKYEQNTSDENVGTLNMGMNEDHTDFIGKINLTSGNTVQINDANYNIVTSEVQSFIPSINYVFGSDFTQTKSVSLSGNLYGFGHTIDLDITSSTSNVAFIGTSSGKIISGINLTGSVTNGGTSQYTASLLAYGNFSTETSIREIISDVTVIGKKTTGGIAGYLKNTNLDNIYVNNASITANSDNVGGIAGAVYNVSLADSQVTDSSITGSSYTGGAIGYFADGTNSISDVSIINSEINGQNYTGGLIGSVKDGVSSLSNFSNILIQGVDVSGGISVGGLAGSLYRATLIDIEVSDTNVDSNNFSAGGIVGNLNNSTITNAVFKGTYDSNTDTYSASVSGGNSVGGIAGTAGGGFTMDNTDVSGALIQNIENGSGRIGGIIGSASIYGYGTTILTNADVSDTIIKSNATKIGGLIGESLFTPGTSGVFTLSDSTFAGTISANAD